MTPIGVERRAECYAGSRAVTNFDGSNLGGTHNAQGNNSVFAYAWFAF